MTRFFAFCVLLSSGLHAAPLPPVAPFLEQHCTECHDGEVKKGGLDLTALVFKPEERTNFGGWVKVYDRVSKGEMPPAKKHQPEAGDVKTFLAAIKRPLREYELAEQAVKGRTVLRRLNRTEYENTVHDLLGVSVPLKQILPEDTPMHGFDTVAEGLRFSQLQIEKYLEAADVALDAAIVLSKRPAGINQRYSYKNEAAIRKNLDTPAGTLSDKTNPKSGHRVMFRENDEEVIMFNTGDYLVALKQCRLPGPGDYRIKLSGRAVQSEGEALTLMIYGNNYKTKRLLSYCELPGDKRREFEFIARMDGSEHLVINCDRVGRDAKGQSIYNAGAADFKGTGIAMQWIEVEGPLSAEWPPGSVRKAVGEVPLKELDEKQKKYRDGKQVGYEFAPVDVKLAIANGLNGFAARAFRRPLDGDEAAPYIALAMQSLDEGRSFEEAMRVGLRAILTSPAFLLLEEHPGKLSDRALATRLAYFLTSSMPDDELIKVAGEGQLSKPAVLRAQTERLLKGAKAGTFVTNFVGQWLELRNIDATTPDAKLYPEYDMLLKLGMVTETEAFFSEMLKENLPVANLIQSDFAMVNNRMAEHYELPGVAGEQFRRVPLPAQSPRGGVLTQASVLKVTANGTVTSPVIRGAWVMKHLLGQPPAPPPASVGAIEPDTRGTTTIREQLAKHRDSETCATCHSQIDPPGFALESFDVIGGWRENYRSNEKGAKPQRKLHGQNIWQYKEGLPVDASGELADGRKFQGIAEFKKLLLTQQEQVMRALAANLVTYGTGAGIQFADRDAVEAIAKKAEADGAGLRSLVHAVVQSPLFLSK